jgi:hypothetical protein
MRLRLIATIRAVSVHAARLLQASRIASSEPSVRTVSEVTARATSVMVYRIDLTGLTAVETKG